MKVLSMDFLGFSDENDVKHGAIQSILSERRVCPNNVFIRKNGLNSFVSRLIFVDINSPTIHGW